MQNPAQVRGPRALGLLWCARTLAASLSVECAPEPLLHPKGLVRPGGHALPGVQPPPRVLCGSPKHWRFVCLQRLVLCGRKSVRNRALCAPFPLCWGDSLGRWGGGWRLGTHGGTAWARSLLILSSGCQHCAEWIFACGFAECCIPRFWHASLCGPEPTNNLSQEGNGALQMLLPRRDCNQIAVIITCKTQRVQQGWGCACEGRGARI